MDDKKTRTPKPTVSLLSETIHSLYWAVDGLDGSLDGTLVDIYSPRLLFANRRRNGGRMSANGKLE